MTHLPKLRNCYWYITINSALDFVWILPVSPLMSIFYPRIPSRIPDYIYLSCLFKVLWSVTVSQSFHVFCDPDSFEGNWSGVLWDAPPLEFVWCFPLIRLRLWVLERKTIEVKCPSHPIPSDSACYQHDLALRMLTLITWLRQCLPGFFGSQTSLSLTRPNCGGGRGLSSTSRGRELNVNYLEFICKDLFHLPHISISMDSCVYFILGVII